MYYYEIKMIDDKFVVFIGGVFFGKFNSNEQALASACEELDRILWNVINKI